MLESTVTVSLNVLLLCSRRRKFHTQQGRLSDQIYSDELKIEQSQIRLESSPSRKKKYHIKKAWRFIFAR
jgi:hypothetical protein